MTSYIEAGKAGDVEEGKVKTYQVQGKDILVAKREGKYYAMQRFCTHMGGDLSKGTLEGKIITCPRHGSRFDITTGESIKGPKILFLKFNTKNAATYLVKVEGGKIKIKID